MTLYSLKEMSKLWGLSDGLLRRYCRDGRIPSAVLEDGSWWIPEGTEKPKGTYKKAPAPVLTSLAKRIIYEHTKNNHHGIYEYIQVNLAYSSCRMASNRLTRKQVIEVYRTDKISSAFEPMKVDDLIEMINHFICMRQAASHICFSKPMLAVLSAMIIPPFICQALLHVFCNLRLLYRGTKSSSVLQTGTSIPRIRG